MRGFIVLAHGSRDPEWSRPVQVVAARIQALAPNALVACAYLEMMTPTLPIAVAQLIQQGAQSLTVLPLFLGMGKHAREDIPRLMQSLQQQYPAVPMTTLSHVGENAQALDLFAQLALASLP